MLWHVDTKHLPRRSSRWTWSWEVESRHCLKRHIYLALLNTWCTVHQFLEVQISCFSVLSAPNLENPSRRRLSNASRTNRIFVWICSRRSSDAGLAGSGARMIFSGIFWDVDEASSVEIEENGTSDVESRRESRRDRIDHLFRIMEIPAIFLDRLSNCRVFSSDCCLFLSRRLILRHIWWWKNAVWVSNAREKETKKKRYGKKISGGCWDSTSQNSCTHIHFDFLLCIRRIWTLYVDQSFQVEYQCVLTHFI